MSPAFADIAGYTPEEMMAMPFEEVLRMIHPDDVARVGHRLNEAATGGQKPSPLEYRFRHKDGSYRWFSDSIAFIRYRIDSTHYNLHTASGAVPGDLAVNDKWAIYRAYTSLSNAEGGTQNSSIPVTFTGGNRDLVTNNEQWNIACYANGTTADSTATAIDGWRGAVRF